MIDTDAAPLPDEATVDIRRIPAGTVVFEQGDQAHSAYLLESGRISMRQSAYGQMVELDVIHPGEVFGEMAVLAGGVRMASAVAVADCTIAVVPAGEFENKLADADAFLRGIITKFIKDIRASYRAFLRRPRSLRDHLRQMRGFTDNIRRYALKIHDEPVSPALLASVEVIDTELMKLLALADECPDRRHDLIIEETDIQGLTVKSVLGTEARRKVTATEGSPQ